MVSLANAVVICDRPWTWRRSHHGCRVVQFRPICAPAVGFLSAAAALIAAAVPRFAISPAAVMIAVTASAMYVRFVRSAASLHFRDGDGGGMGGGRVAVSWDARAARERSETATGGDGDAEAARSRMAGCVTGGCRAMRCHDRNGRVAVARRARAHSPQSSSTADGNAELGDGMGGGGGGGGSCGGEGHVAALRETADRECREPTQMVGRPRSRSEVWRGTSYRGQPDGIVVRVRKLYDRCVSRHRHSPPKGQHVGATRSWSPAASRNAALTRRCEVMRDEGGRRRGKAGPRGRESC